MPAKNKKDAPIVTRFTTFFDFALVDSAAGSNTSEISTSATAAAAPLEHICRLELEIVAGEECPKATENFRQLTAGSVTVGDKKNQRQACYKGTRVLRCTPEMIQLGDTTPMSSAGASSTSAEVVNKTQDTIFGTLIEDEKFGVVPHMFGTVTLCNSGANTNGSQFALIVGKTAADDNDEDAAEEIDKNNQTDEEMIAATAEKMSFLDPRHVSIGLLRDPASSMYQNLTKNFAPSAASVIVQQSSSARSAANNGPSSKAQQQQQDNNNDIASSLDNTATGTGRRMPNENQIEALRRLHEVAMSLVVDGSGKMPNSGRYIVISDCGVL